MSSLRPRKRGRFCRGQEDSPAPGCSGFWRRQLGTVRDRLSIAAQAIEKIARKLDIHEAIHEAAEAAKTRARAFKPGYIGDRAGQLIRAVKGGVKGGVKGAVKEKRWERDALSAVRQGWASLSPQARAAGLGALLFAGAAVFCFLQGPQEIRVNGVPVALAESRSAAESAISQVRAAKSSELGGRPLEVADAVEFSPRPWGVPLNSQELVPVLAEHLNFSLLGTAIKVNGKVAAVLSSPEEAEWVLEMLKERYIAGMSEAEVKEVRFAEEVELAAVPAAASEILPPEEALQRICCGNGAAVQYTVQEGDSLWAIAHRNGIRVEDLIAANPGINPDRLSLGQVISLARSEPAINVVAVAEKTVEETIPYEVEVQYAADKWRGYRKVLKAGQNGLKEMRVRITAYNGRPQAKEILSQAVKREPVKQVEVRGRGYVVASRASSGESTGRLGWPLRGAITSGYGYRGREFHSGIDIDGSYGEAIVAAEDGRVVDAGWNGGYGRTIVIDHGGGLKTLYAHCSSILVDVGDRVERGEVIGRVGSSGRSTGSHLHFEVILNGSTVNPLSFLR